MRDVLVVFPVVLARGLHNAPCVPLVMHEAVVPLIVAISGPLGRPGVQG